MAVLSKLKRSGPVAGDVESGVFSSDEEPYGRSSWRKISFPIPSIYGQEFCSNQITTNKYSCLNFLPRFLFEQLRSYSNVVQLIGAILQQIPNDAATGRYGMLVSLLISLGSSAATEIRNELACRKADEEVNEREIEMLHAGQWVMEKWKNLRVGDIVRVQDGSLIPADLLLLSSSDEQRQCYIETSSLDGETNLKIRQCLDVTARYRTPEELSSLEGNLRYSPPSRELDEFSGTLQLRGMSESVAIGGVEQLLLRGGQLKGTDWAIGLVLYTGRDTKLELNSALRAPIKRPKVDRAVDTLNAVMFSILISGSAVLAYFGSRWADSTGAVRAWLLNLLDVWTSACFGQFAAFVVLLSPAVPYSLPGVMAVSRYLQARVIGNDLEMTDEGSNTPARVKSPNLNEDLGLVQHVFMDKTGTLTKNNMKLVKCSIGGKIYSVSPPVAVQSDTERYARYAREFPKTVTDQGMREFLTLLAVCNNAIPEGRGKEPQELPNYLTTNSDDRALVEGAARLGCVLKSRTPQQLTILVDGREESHELLHVFYFTSERKRMSVIVRTPSGKIKLYVKGADEVINERLGAPSAFGQPPNQEHVRGMTEIHVAQFAEEGLRTLFCAMAEIPLDVYENWRRKREGGEDNLADAADLFEKNLTLLGATGIEDELQDEVPETIDSMRSAGIQMWMLTGDKLESAINVGYASHLLERNMQLVVINEQSLEGTRIAVENELRYLEDFLALYDSSPQIALVVGGASVKHAMSCDLKKPFVQLCLKSRAVICCRVSPSQKAEIVKAINEEVGAVTLAIGDGANDVPMIQKASIGIGISGHDGLDASRASDYSIGQFRFLRRLLFVHGSQNLYRTRQRIVFVFYKGIAFHALHLLFFVKYAWPGTTLLHPWAMTVYNLVFTWFLPVALTYFDRPTELAMERPDFYRRAREGEYLNWKLLGFEATRAFVHASLVGIMSEKLFRQDTLWGNEGDGGHLVPATAVYTYLVLTICLTAARKTRNSSIISIVGSAVIWFLFIAVFSLIGDYITGGAEMTGIARTLVTSGVFWLGLFLIPSATHLLDAPLESLLLFNEGPNRDE